MNRLCFRLVFNPTRGIPMAVAECARSHPRGGTPGRHASPGRTFHSQCETHLRALAAAVMFISGSLLWPAQAGAQIVADAHAPGGQRPTILTAPNGVPLVNIQTPSAAGVSRNTYSQFDIPVAGAILNNARGTATTRLGGLVQGNPWLAGGSAKVILNEVNAANPSQLLGYLEVGGARAEVIIANPAGILCNGCGFINANRATLTTGAPVVTEGRLDGYRVGNGTLVIDGLGLDARDTEFTHLIARAIRLNAGVWAQDLQVTTGAADVTADGSVATPRTPANPAPTIALDVAALGGMYAGKIHLIGTESGVGFRNTGQIGASAGEVRIDQRGWIDNSGQIDSATRISLTTPATLASSGALRAGGDAVLTADAGLTLDGSAVAAGDLSLAATGPGARVTSGANAWLVAGYGSAGGALTLSAAGPLAAHGTLIGGATIDARAISLDLTGARITAPAVQLNATLGDLNLSASRLHAEDRLTASTPGVLRSTTANVSAGQLSLAAHNLDNAGGVLLQLGANPLQLNFAGTLDNSGGRLASNAASIALGAATLLNRGGQIEHTGNGTLSIGANTFIGSDGQVITQGGLELTAGHLNLDHAQTQATQLALTAIKFSHRQGTLLQTGTAPASLTVSGPLDNQDGRISANASVTVSAGNLNNDGGRLDTQLGNLTVSADVISNYRGQLYTANNLHIVANTLTNLDGSAYAVGDATVSLSRGFEHGGVLAAGRDLGVGAAWINAGASSLIAAGMQPGGRLEGDGALTLQARSTLVANGQNLAAGTLTIAADQLDLSGSATSARGLALSANQLDAHAARLVATEQLQTQIGGRLDGRNAYLRANHLDLNAASLDISGGTLVSSGARAVRLQLPGELINRGGQITSNADLTLDVATVDNRGGRIVTTQDAQFTATVTGALDNTGGLIAGNNGLTLSAARVVNVTGQLETAAGAAHIRADHFDNASGNLFAATDLTLSGGDLTNPGGRLYAGYDATLSLSGALLHDGVLAAGRHLAVSATRIDATINSLVAAGLQSDGHIAGTGTLTAQASTTFTARGQTLAASALSLSAPQLDLTGSQNTAQAIRLNADTLMLTRANTHAETSLDIQASDLLDTRAARLSAAQLGIKAQRLDNTGGDVRQTGSGDLHIALPGTLINTHGQIVSNGNNLHLSAAEMDNRGGLIGLAGSGLLTIDTMHFVGSGGQIISNGQLDLSARHLALDKATTQANTWHITADTLDHQH
ncbi:MAG: filamentous hemagglutinin N-terminal domain-containing protein, partial [Burkholderiaceae bacterium]